MITISTCYITLQENFNSKELLFTRECGTTGALRATYGCRKTFNEMSAKETLSK